jgi:hypothetical protein
MHLKEQKCFSKPKDKQYQIYEANMIAEWILKDQVPVGVGACYAAFLVGEKAVKLQKVEDWADAWGGKRREVDSATQIPALVKCPT